MKRSPPALLGRLERFAPVTAISVIVYGELWFGRNSSSHPDAASASLVALLESIEVLRPTLDDVFLTLTGRSLRDAEAATEDRTPATAGKEN